MLKRIRLSNDKKRCLSNDEIEEHDEKTTVLNSDKKGIETDYNIKSTNNETIVEKAILNIVPIENKQSNIEKKPTFHQIDAFLKTNAEKIFSEESIKY